MIENPTIPELTTATEDFIRSLTVKRKRLGWTIRQLAEKAGVPYDTALGIELAIGLPYDPRYSSQLIETLEEATKDDLEKRLKELKSSISNEDIQKRQNRNIQEIKKWATNFDRCIRCGNDENKHVARGLCVRCYRIESERKHKKHTRKRGVAGKILTEGYLVEQYSNRERSLIDIAKECYCTRQYVYKMMKAYQIPLRNKSSARSLALERSKLKFNRLDEKGDEYSVTLHKMEVNETFFSSWSDGMAWVLGLLYSGGNLSFDTKGKPFLLQITQKEPELLSKIKTMMNCNVKLSFTPRRRYGAVVAGRLYRLRLNNYRIYADLVRIGLKPDKNLDMNFPDIPSEYVRHFIRGCWDGDGLVYFHKGQSRIVASYVSGSLSFLTTFLQHLERTGLKRRQIYCSTYGRKNPSYYFRLSDSECEKLYRYLYDNVTPEQYLERKYAVFRDFFGTIKPKSDLPANSYKITRERYGDPYLEL
jgi:transcriptional regulator with XRE-family HTH domain